MKEVDDNFFNRADEHIHLSNDQVSNAGIGKVSASMLYSVARFNAWVSACRFNNKQEMEAAKDEIFEYFVTEYKKMLNENLDDYIEHFDNYMSNK